MKIFLFLSLIVLTTQGFAQDVSSAKLLWTVTELKDLNTNKTQAYSCEFTTSGVQGISWSQKSGAMITEFVVVSSSGTWADVTKRGSLLYQITYDGSPGSISFARTNSGLSITLDLSLGDGKRLNHRYTVSQVSLSN